MVNHEKRSYVIHRKGARNKMKDYTTKLKNIYHPVYENRFIYVYKLMNMQ